MDVARAFTYVTEDERWIGKLGIGAIVTIVAPFLLGFPFLLLIGYSVGITRNVKKGVKLPLPEWDDWGQLFQDGAIIAIAQIVYTLPFWLLACITFFATVGFGGLAEASEEIAMAGLSATLLLVVCLAVLFAIALLFISPAIVIQYVRANDFGACFRFGEVIAIARHNVGDILIVFIATLLMSVVVSAVFGTLNIIPCIGQIITVILGFLVGPYMTAVTGHLYGQIAAKAPGKGSTF